MARPDHPADFETHFEHAPVGLGIVDREFRYLRLNATLALLNGVPAHEHLGRTVAEVLPGLWPALEPHYQAALRGETVAEQEVSGPIRGWGDEIRHRVARYFPVRDGDIISGVGIVVNDVTDDRRVREDLRVRTDLYAMLAQTNRAVSERTTVDHLFRQICQLAVEVGQFRFAWIGVSDGETMRPVASAGDGGYLDDITVVLVESDARSRGPMGCALRTSAPQFENDFQNAAWTAPWHAAARQVGFGSGAALPLVEAGRPVAVLALYAREPGFFTPERVEILSAVPRAVAFALDAFRRDRERSRDEAALHLRDRAISAIGHGICITDPRQDDNPIIFASPGFQRLTGYRASDVVGRNCRFLQGPETDPASKEVIRHAVETATSCTVELLNYRKDGTSFWNSLTLSPVIDDAGTLTHYVGVQVDVSERRQLEARMHAAEKLEAVGHLARGVAHDFNNILTVIGGWSEVLQAQIPTDSPMRDAAVEIRRSIERASALTRQLLAFSEPHTSLPMVVDLNVVIGEAAPMLRRVLGEGIRLVTRTTRRLWPTQVNAEALEQSLIGIASQAHDALLTGGTVTITTGLVTEGSAPADIPPGEYVSVEIRSSGNGPDETFCTDASQVALSAVMREAGGYATIAPTGSGETTVRLFLPRAPLEPATVESAVGPESLPGGNETILLVEDEDSLRSISRHVLDDCGYTVMEAGNGVEALDIIRNYRGHIQLVISDVVMPHLGGRRLAEALRVARPDAKLLFMSGYTDDEVVRHGIDVSEVAFLPKPFTGLRLAQAARDALDQPQRPLRIQR